VLILGLSALGHDSAAALLGEQHIEAAIEESKMLRLRSVGGIPRAAIRFCLDRAHLGWLDISYVAVASRPFRAWIRQAWLRGKLAPLAPISSGYYLSRSLGELSQELNNFRILKSMVESPRCRVIGLEHHVCHAASAFYASPFDRAAILTLDEQGDGWSGLLAVGEGNRIRVLRPIAFPNSLGWVYTQVTDLLGFAPHQEEHKTQWLGLGAEPVFRDVFLEMLRDGPNPLPRLNPSYFHRGLAGRIAFSEKFYRRVGIAGGGQSAIRDPIRRELSSSMQEACAVVVTDLADWLRRQTGSRALCLAGGLFLNVLLVAALEKNTRFDEIFVQPAAGNAGCALGAAWLVWHQLLGKPRFEPILHPYWGPSYTNQEIKEVLDNCKVHYSWYDTEAEKIQETIRLLEAGKIVAWYQGATEFGPRALGNRSLLASPWAPYVTENLNEYVKHREAFRPFAISVPEEDCARYFDCSPAGQFMASVGWVRPGCCSGLESIVLPGDRLRLHVVKRQSNPLFWRLLKQFGQRAPAPLLVNTSFNLFGEPLVTTPREAVRSFFCSGIDALVIGNFGLTKS